MNIVIVTNHHGSQQEFYGWTYNVAKDGSLLLRNPDTGTTACYGPGLWLPPVREVEADDE